jgi:glycosyltransferase involved in cell wall biosynthesis
MKNKIIAFSKYLSYMLGGAEKSTYEILKQEENKSIKIVSFSNINSFGANNKKIEFPENWEIEHLSNMKQFHKFFYWEYLFNRNEIKNYFSKVDNTNTILYTYAIYAPIAIIAFNGNSKLFIRSETDLAINKNYHQGIKKYLKNIYMFMELIPFYIYKSDLKKAIIKSEVICNSQYMSQKLFKLYAKKSNVLYPFIDETRLKEEFKSLKDTIQEKGIVFVGDAIIKGVEIAKNIAQNLPEKKFYFFSRYVTNEKIDKNITYIPWQKREVDIYKYAKIVIVPSIWEEAYGRVSREAYVLNIPVLVSNIGGLPESVDEKQEFIINDYLNIENWVQAIENFS